MGIRDKLDRLAARLHDVPQYNSQGAVLFVDLERRTTLKKYLPLEVMRNFLGGRGANMWLLYNLLEDERASLDPEIPIIFGAGILTSSMPSATRGNFSSISPESDAILDANGGDYFPSFLRTHGYDHLVMFGRAPPERVSVSQKLTFASPFTCSPPSRAELIVPLKPDEICTDRMFLSVWANLR